MTPIDERRFRDLEKRLDENEEKMEPVILLYRSGKLLGGILIVLIGAAAAFVTVWGFLYDHLTGHAK